MRGVTNQPFVIYENLVYPLHPAQKKGTENEKALYVKWRALGFLLRIAGLGRREIPALKARIGKQDNGQIHHLPVTDIALNFRTWPVCSYCLSKSLLIIPRSLKILEIVPAFRSLLPQLGMVVLVKFLGLNQTSWLPLA